MKFIVGLVLLWLAIFLVLAFSSNIIGYEFAGLLGSIISRQLFKVFGQGIWLMPLLCGYWSILCLRHKKIFWINYIAATIAIVSLAVLAGLFGMGGGIIGDNLAKFIKINLNITAYLLVLLSLFVALPLCFPDFLKNIYRLRKKKGEKSSSTNSYSPPLELLKEKNSSGGNSHDIKDLKVADVLAKILQNFGISAKINGIVRAPAVTRIELQLLGNSKVTQLMSLSDDIALSLGVDAVRIEAPVPGRAVVGIEVPNKKIELVQLSQLLLDRRFQMADYSLPIALGKNINGEVVVEDLAALPHLLVAGTTGSGKTVVLFCIILSLVAKLSPKRLNLVLIDPKLVEFDCFRSLPHLCTQIINAPKEAIVILTSLVELMQERYKIFKSEKVRDIGEYNLKKSLPYIVVVIDELCDLMMSSLRDCEEAIIRIAQMGRAAGIHLVVATQRPSVDVVTGVIKANLPARIALRVCSKIDSRTILDYTGAECLLGSGDMLLYLPGMSKPQRIQGGYVSRKNIQSFVDAIKSLNLAPAQPLKIIRQDNKDKVQRDDELYDDAIEVVKSAGYASISLLQRKLHIGYNRAARIVEWLEEDGVIGPPSYKAQRGRDVFID